MHSVYNLERMVNIIGQPDLVGIPEEIEEVDMSTLSKIAGDVWIDKWRGFHDCIRVFVGNKHICRM